MSQDQQSEVSVTPKSIDSKDPVVKNKGQKYDNRLRADRDRNDVAFND